MNDLDEYLVANRDRFTREALTERLVAGGHDPAEVEAAWARLDDGSDVAGAAKTGEVGAGTVLLATAIFLGYGFAIVLAGAFIFYGGAVTFLMLLYVAAMIGGLIVSVRRLVGAPKTRPGWSPIWIAVGLSAVIFVGLSGTCFAALGGAISASGGLR